MVELGWLYVFSECFPSLDPNLKCNRHCRRGVLDSARCVAFVKGVVQSNSWDFAGWAGK